MNHILPLIWNPATQSYCPAPTAARNTRKGSGRRLALALAVATATSGAYAGPTGGVVIDGDANIDIRGKLTDILQNTQNTTIVWDNFDINADEIVNFIQPNDTSIALNRVFSADGTQINGQLNANGRVFVLDANGVLFGQDASVNVGSLVASTLDVSHNDYTNFSFSGNGNPAAVTNLGHISVADSGAVALLGGQVSNRGVIQAKLGNVALAAGNKITLDFAGDGLLNVQVDEAALDALAENHGLIQANGGRVLMTAHASDALLQTVVNNTGVIEAQTLQEQDGKIMLLGGFNGGTVSVSGKLDASAPDGGDGGFIETSGNIVKVAASATLDASSADGEAGTWLLDPTDLEISYNAMGANDDVSHVHTQALQNSLEGGSDVTLQTVNTGSGNGDISILDPIIWSTANTLNLDADGGITFSDYIQAPGGGLNLTALGDITTGVEGHINVAAFTLESGDFSQISANLPVFSADDFTLNGGTFTRAAGGNGSGSPLLLQDAYGLQGLATTPGFNATLVNDIDLSGISNFTPIGTDAAPYEGSFDGAGHFVDNLSINSSDYNVGLFGFVGTSGSITAVGLHEANVVGGADTGVLVGQNQGSVSASFTTGSVTADDSVGGLVGWNTNGGSVSSSYSTATVSGTGGAARAGGLVGYNGDTTGDASFISDSWASGAVTGGVGNVGGLLGLNNTTGDISNSYFDADTTSQIVAIGADTGASSGNAAVSGNGGLNPSAFAEGSYAALDFSNDWFIAEGSSRPMLRAFLDGGNISNLYQLQGMAADLAGSYTLLNDIDASASADSVAAGNGGNFSDVWGGHGFAPVGTASDKFTGTLDGAGFVVNGLTINRPNQNYVGLLGWTDSSRVQDLGLTGVDIIGQHYVGGLVGYNGGSGNDSISTSYATGAVEGGFDVGGLVGYSDDNIDSSYATVTVSGTDYVGGLVGCNNGSIATSYATGTVNGSNDVGGLVGYNYTNITTSYATGAVSGSSSVGGLVGNNVGSVTSSYWDTFTTGQPSSDGGTSVSGDWNNSPDAYNSGTYTGFDFTSSGDWFIAEGSSRPMLRAFLSGGGEIHNLYDLQGMAANMGGSYTLMDDIDASATADSVAAGNSGDYSDVWGGRGFAPVANASNAFQGSLDGQNHVINQLNSNRPDQFSVGLISILDSTGQIENIGLVDATITGDNVVGGLVGWSYGGSIERSYVTGTVTGDNRVGGLVGDNNADISDSYSTAGVSGTSDNIGGLVGLHNSGTISTSYTTGIVTGASNSGGLVGWNAGGGNITTSFWNSTNADGIGLNDGNIDAASTGLTLTEFTQLTSFASWGADIDAEGGTGSTWRIYEGNSAPLLRSFLTEIEVTAYDDHQVYDGGEYDGLHDINGTTGAGVRYGDNYAEFIAAFGEDGTPYSSDDVNSADLEYTGDSQGAVDAGTYDLTPSELWSNQAGYDIVMTDGTLTIEQLAVRVTVTIDDASKIYGEADPSFSWDVTNGSLASGDTLTGSLSREAGEDVGNYAITGNITGDLTSGNYDVTLVDGVFTITPRAITVDIADLAKVYGNDDPNFTWAITGGSLAEGDELSGTLSRVAGEDVGGYAITGTLEGDLASNNYTVTVDDGMLTITPRPLVISADDLAKIYGEEDPELTWSQGGTVVDGDTLMVSLSRTEGQDVGYYTITPEVTGDVTGDNYNLSVNSGALQVTPAALTVTADDIEAYWNLLPPFTASLDGLTNGDTEQDVFGNSLVVTSDLELPIPGEYTLTPVATLASNNYNVTFTDGVLTLLSSNPGNGYGDGLTSTQLPAREALGRDDRANIFEGRALLDGKLDEISLGVYQDGVRLPDELLTNIGLLMPRAVLFGINSDKVDDIYVEMLQNFVAKLDRYPEFNLLIEGHTSNTGPRLLNEKLARKRAMAVYNLLVELGVDPARLGTKGFSWLRPVADNSTLAGRALNRRTEITPDQPSADQDAKTDSDADQ